MRSLGHWRGLACGVWIAGAGFTVLASGACSSSQPETPFVNDSGVPGTPGGPDATTPLLDSGPPPNLMQDSGGPASDDSGSVQPQSSDAAFSFDGFAHPDGYSEASYCTDDDGDGFTTCAGDCNDHDSLVNPCAFDTNAASGDPVGSDGIDNDCDGQIDNRRLCDTGLSGHDTNAIDYARAIDLCEGVSPTKCPTVVSATFNTLSDPTARRVTAHMGTTFKPHAGAVMTFLSSGIADDDTDTPGYATGDGHDFGKGGTNPDPLNPAQNPNACSATGADEHTVSANDIVEFDLTLRAPVNAGSFTFDFNFFSEEYPKYVCAGFNDTFLAELTSIQYPVSMYPAGFQIAFDSLGHRVNVNNGFFADCSSVAPPTEAFTHNCSGALSLLTGTGYEIKYSGNDNQGSGATDWLKTTAPIKAGETFTLRFYIFDEQDGILDSAINLDNFRWGSISVPNPITAR